MTYVIFISLIESSMHGTLYEVTLCQLTRYTVSKAYLTNNI